MYVAAVLCARGTSSPVRIRNMSPSGALIEGALEVAEGELVHLVRGGLTAEAWVVWSTAGRCGLKFSAPVEVKRWLSPPTNAEQQRVDALVRLVQAGAVPLPVPDLDPPAVTELDHTRRFADDLRRVEALLGTLSDRLAEHPRIVEEHGEALQSLDIAMQTLAAIAAELAGRADGDSDGAKLGSLRRSAIKALNRPA